MTTPNNSIKPEYVFTYHLKNKKPVELETFTKSLIALQKEYTDYAQGIGLKGTDSKLYVYKVEEGSIIVELVEFASVGLLPIAEITSTIVSFAEKFTNLIKYLAGQKEERPNNITSSSLRNCSDIVTPIINDNKGTIEFNIKKADSETTTTNNYIGCVFNSTETNAIQNKAKIEEDEVKTTSSNTQKYPNVILKINQLNSAKMKADKGVIESISNKEVSLIFPEEDKNELTQESEINPFSKLFYVDATVHYYSDKIATYVIEKIHKCIDIED